VSASGGFRYHAGLDGLRGLAVAAVVAYHFGWIDGGFLGVDAFFVLSGFLITSLLVAEHRRDGRIALGDFWARRARRLLPALLLLVTVLVMFAQKDVLRADVLSTLGYVANWHQVWTGASYFDLFAESSPLKHAWSLAVEEQFYIVWPLVVAVVLRFAGRRTLGALCGVGMIASAVAMAAWYTPGDPSRVYYGTDTRAQLLFIGALAALLPRLRVPRAVGAAALASSIVMMFTVSDQDAFLYRGGMLGHGLLVAAAISAVVAHPGAIVSRVLGANPLRGLGKVSYGVYLWHWPVLVLCTPERVGVSGFRLDLVRLAIIAVATAVSYYLVEQPIRHLRVPARPVLAGSAAALVAVVALALVVVPAPVTTRVFLTSAPSLEAAAAAPAAPAPPPTIAPAPAASVPVIREPHAIGVVGDSVASTVAFGLDAVAEDNGVQVVSVAMPGCGVAAGVVLKEDGTAFDWSDECAQAMPTVLDGLIANDDPDVVVWLSTWELGDREVNGRHLRWGTKAYDDALVNAVDEQARRLTARGAHIVFLTPVPHAPNDRPFPDAPPERYEHYRDLLEQYAADHPYQASVVDLMPLVCPSGPPCPMEVDGVELRPDGTHFSEETAPKVAEKLLPLILDAVRD
jgi:peptidoglycan/LPS O-acetylase OafA/YrhL